ncbi:MAG TPA: hypothetical protein VHF69_12140 [Candidatus Synoicihabitans sp.]|nr:hypothetical protein [Candidatus Synoicihabitans sp.]
MTPSSGTKHKSAPVKNGASGFSFALWLGVIAIASLSSDLRANTTPPSPPEGNPLSLADLEAQPEISGSAAEFGALAAQRNQQVQRLIETGALVTGDEFYRAYRLVTSDSRFRTARLCYELLLAAAALDHPDAIQHLPFGWDMLLASIGRPLRIDASGLAERYPESFENAPAPAAVQAVLRNPEQARETAKTAEPNAEIQQIVDADQADRRNWSSLTNEERQAMTERDQTRNQRIRDIIAAGDLRTAGDFANAALVMQHSGRFSGYQTAHELALCALVLGDRGRGRWLVAATYDRMLGSVGHEQRFGTQYTGMGGAYTLAPLDPTGISDAQRRALGCPTLEEARTRTLRGSAGTNALVAAFRGPGRALRDPQYGLAVALPETWALRHVARWGDQQTTLQFEIADEPKLTLNLYYRIYREERPAHTLGTADHLTDEARKKETSRRETAADYMNRPDSLRIFTLGGHSAASWVADFTDPKGVASSEYLVRIETPVADVLGFATGPTEQVEQHRDEFDRLMKSIEVPTRTP